MLMNRRSFLASASGALLATQLAGCQRSNAADLRLAMLANAVPAQLLRAFQQVPPGGIGVAVNPQESLLALYSLLQNWHSQTEEDASPIADWVSLADYWLAPAMGQGLVQPVDVSSLSHWEELAAVWPELVRRSEQGSPSTEGSIWGVPYRWSHLVLLYDPSRLARDTAPLATWADLLRPELTRRVILPDHPRLVLGLTQKALGVSANGEDPASVAGLESFVGDLHQQVRAYDSDHYLESLIIGDAIAVAAWSDEVWPLLKQYRQLAAVVPPEGTLLSAQLWVRPQAQVTAEKAAPEVFDWLNFCLTDDFATQLAIFGQSTSTRLWGMSPEQLPEPLQQPPGLALPLEVAAQSEFLIPLPKEAEENYLNLWRSMRS